MADRERRMTPPYGGVFVARSRIMDADDLRRAIRRMAHETIERNESTRDLVLIGQGLAHAHLLRALSGE